MFHPSSSLLTLLAVLSFLTPYSIGWPDQMPGVQVTKNQTAASGSGHEIRLLRYPDISRDAVVFTYAGSLWTVPRSGGLAHRLSQREGNEFLPKFSPDAKTIAYSGDYNGNTDVYTMPAQGGTPRRLTYRPGADKVVGWEPSGQRILFRSNRQSTVSSHTRLFLASPQGGLPSMMPLLRASLSSFSPDGERVAFNNQSPDDASEFENWKHYRGGMMYHIGIYDLQRNIYDQIPNHGSNDMFPMWHSDSIYFISDRDGVMNLYVYSLSKKNTQQLTAYKEYDIKWPSLGPDAIVYENGGRLYYHDLESGREINITVYAPNNSATPTTETKSAANFIRRFDISPDGDQVTLEARGDIFTITRAGGATENLTQTSGTHEQKPVWSPDGKWIAYLSDRSGEFELYIRPSGGGAEIRITRDGDCYRWGPFWSPDSKKLMYFDQKQRFYFVDIEKKEPVLFDQAAYGIDYTSRGSSSPPNWSPWSPDSRWIAYAKPGPGILIPRTGAIYLYSLDQHRVFRISDELYQDSSPVFDRSGKYLYFVSQRFFRPTLDQYDDRFYYANTQGIFAVILDQNAPSPLNKSGTTVNNEVNQEGSNEEGSRTRIDVEGLHNRVVQLPIDPGTYSFLQTRGGRLFYLASARDSSQPDLHVFDLQSLTDRLWLKGVNSYAPDKSGKWVVYRSGTSYGIADASSESARVGDGKLDTSDLQIHIDPRDEWQETFREAWRFERDFYDDPAMGGVDWNKIRQRYEALLPWVVDDRDLYYVIGQMIAELRTSHIIVSYRPEITATPEANGLLGVDYAAEGAYYKFAKIYRGETWNKQSRSPLAEPGLKVKEGDYLIAVNGKALRVPDDPDALFVNLAGKEVMLKINDRPAEEGAWEIPIKPLSTEAGLRYLDWVESRRKYVDSATRGQVGYIHVSGTSPGDIAVFDKYFIAQLDKRALIIDARFNDGGFLPDFFIEKLQRKRVLLQSPRGVKDIPLSRVAIDGPKVLIINEVARSGGDALAWLFKDQKLGPVVGTRTWGGLMVTLGAVPFIAAGNVTAPESGIWSPQNGGQWIVENRGVEPDYPVEQSPDLEIKGRDPQLDKAIELIQRALLSIPPGPQRPEYPNKARN